MRIRKTKVPKPKVGSTKAIVKENGSINYYKKSENGRWKKTGTFGSKKKS